MGNASLFASAKALPSVELVGIIGFTNLGLLTLISLWRTIVLLAYSTDKDHRDATFRKKLVLHILLLLSTATDLPMYFSFISLNGYEVVTYAFHKFECAFIFSAYSITITDWSAVLYEINEDSRVPFLLKRGIIWTINLLVVVIAILNFIFCLAMNNLDTYTQTPIYIMGVVTQLLASFLLTCVMLQGGIKLAWRIQGASGQTVGQSMGLDSLAAAITACGNACATGLLALPGAVADCTRVLFCVRSAKEREECLDATSGRGALLKGSSVASLDPLDRSAHSRSSGSTTTASQTTGSANNASFSVNGSTANTNTNTNVNANTNASSERGTSAEMRTTEFLSALRCLNIVMATCASCEFIQMTLLWLNWFLGYADSQSQTVGNVYFYWTFYAWFPLWGVVLSLLYLSTSRNSSSLRKRNSPAAAAQPAADGGALSQPLLSSPNRDPQRVVSHDSEVASSPSTSFGSGYSSQLGRSSSIQSQLASDIFFRDIAASHAIGINYSADYSYHAATER